MNSFQVALVMGALVVALASWQLERSLLWITTAATSFLASALWEGYGLPMPALFTACCDAAVCFTIYACAKQAWELWLYRLFQASVLISIVYVGFTIFPPKMAPHYFYVTSLEGVNWLALLLILGTAAMQRIDAHGGIAAHLRGSFVRRAQQALFSPTSPHHWWIA